MAESLYLFSFFLGIFTTHHMLYKSAQAFGE